MAYRNGSCVGFSKLGEVIKLPDPWALPSANDPSDNVAYMNMSTKKLVLRKP